MHNSRIRGIQTRIHHILLNKKSSSNLKPSAIFAAESRTLLKPSTITCNFRLFGAGADLSVPRRSAHRKPHTAPRWEVSERGPGPAHRFAKPPSKSDLLAAVAPDFLWFPFFHNSNTPHPTVRAKTARRRRWTGSWICLEVMVSQPLLGKILNSKRLLKADPSS